jgi:hypothetical protein
MHRFIIVGGGAGGLELATRLGDRYGSTDRKKTPEAQITLIDRNPTHIWKPLLHEVAAGSMDPFTQNSNTRRRRCGTASSSRRANWSRWIAGQSASRSARCVTTKPAN